MSRESNNAAWWYKPWRRRWLRIVLLIVLGGVIGAWGMGWVIQYKMQAMMAGGGPKGGPKMSMPVEAAAVKVTDLDDSVNVPGSIAAEKGAVLRPELAGTIKSVPLAAGTEVKPGQVLIQMNDTSERGDAAQALASMRLAERNWKRLQALRAEDKDLVSQKDYDTAQSTYEQAAATYQAANSQLQKKRITAPFAGVVGIAQVNPGDYVNVGTALVSLQTLKSLRVDFALPERFSDIMLAGEPVRVHLTALNRDVTATVVAADPLIDSTSRNLPVRAHIDNPDGSIKPGMFGEVTVSRGHIADALMIPEAAIMPEGDRNFVYRFVNDPSSTQGAAQPQPAAPNDKPGDRLAAPAGPSAKVAARTEVELGLHVNGLVQVVSGLTPQDVVVSAGQLKIGPGAPIVAMNIGMVSATAPQATSATTSASAPQAGAPTVSPTVAPVARPRPTMELLSPENPTAGVSATEQ